MRVLRITQSPMNAKRWVLELGCGHEVWVTRERRPTRQDVKCPECTARPADADEAGGS